MTDRSVSRRGMRGRRPRPKWVLIGLGAAVFLSVGVAAANASTIGNSSTVEQSSLSDTIKVADTGMLEMSSGTDESMVDPTAAAPANAPSVEYRVASAPADRTFTELLGLNDVNKAVGFFGSGADAKHPTHGLVLTLERRDIDVTTVNIPGAVQTEVTGVNNAGDLVGFFVAKNGANLGFIKRRGVITTVAVPAGKAAKHPVTRLLGINDKGFAVGFFNDAKGVPHGFSFQIATRRFLILALPLATVGVVVTSVNDRGDIGGFFVVGKSTFGFFIRKRLLTILDLGGKATTRVLGVNNDGSLVGSFVDQKDRTHGFVLLQRDRRVRQIDVPGAVGLTVVSDINNRGQIDGFFRDKAGRTAGFIARLIRT